MIKIDEIKQGNLYEIVTDNFLTSGKHHEIKRPVNLKKHEIIEIRFPFAWHFRTEDNIYFHAFENMIIENCEYFAEILEDVRFGNKANLSEILKLHLYGHEANKNGNYYQLLKRKGLTDDAALKACR